MTPDAFIYTSILNTGSSLTVMGAWTPFVTREHIFVYLNLGSKCRGSSLRADGHPRIIES